MGKEPERLAEVPASLEDRGKIRPETYASDRTAGRILSPLQ